MLVHIRRMGGQCAFGYRRGYGNWRTEPDPVQRVLSGYRDRLILSPEPVLRPDDHAVYNADDPNIIQMGSNEKQELNLYFPHIRAHVADTHLSVSNAPPPFITVFSRISFLFLFLAEFQINILLRCRILKQTR